jgi:hypothetical protein
MNTITSGQKEMQNSLNTADQAEMDLIIEMKKLGKKSLTIWSQNQAHEAEENITINNSDISSKGKKTPLTIQNRSDSCTANFLSGFKGAPQCDGYSAYNDLYKAEDILRIGRIDHARRKFHDVYKASGKKQVLLKMYLNLIRRLYKIEEDAKNQNLSPILPKIKGVGTEAKNNSNIMTSEKLEELFRDILPCNVDKEVLR